MDIFKHTQLVKGTKTLIYDIISVHWIEIEIKRNKKRVYYMNLANSIPLD